jgi:Domain of unknown function (DUF4258)
MKPRIPELLLILYILLPMKSALITQVLLCQIRAIHTARQAEKKLDLDLENDTDEALRDFLVSFWVSPSNALAYAYIGLLSPYLGLFNHPVIEIRRKVVNRKFEFSKHAVDHSIIHQICTNDIEEAVTNGHLIADYSNNKHNSSYLICGLTQAERPVHIKCGYHTRPFIKIIAVYEPDSELWNDNFTMRVRNSNGDL